MNKIAMIWLNICMFELVFIVIEIACIRLTRKHSIDWIFLAIPIIAGCVLTVTTLLGDV